MREGSGYHSQLRCSGNKSVSRQKLHRTGGKKKKQGNLTKILTVVSLLWPQLITAVVTKNWKEIVQSCDLQNWREALAAVLTYARPDEFAALCGKDALQTNDIYPTCCRNYALPLFSPFR